MKKKISTKNFEKFFFSNICRLIYQNVQFCFSRTLHFLDLFESKWLCEYIIKWNNMGVHSQYLYLHSKKKQIYISDNKHKKKRKPKCQEAMTHVSPATATGSPLWPDWPTGSRPAIIWIFEIMRLFLIKDGAFRSLCV